MHHSHCYHHYHNDYNNSQLVDRMLWVSFERHINAFRQNILGLEPVRVGQGGWNQLNTLRVSE